MQKWCVIILFNMLLAACVTPKNTAINGAADSKACEPPSVYQVDVPVSAAEITSRFEEMLVSKDSYVQDGDYNRLRQSYDMPSLGEEGIRIIINDDRASYSGLVLVEVSKRKQRQQCKDSFLYEIKILTEGETRYPRRGVAEDVVVTRSSEISYDEYNALRSGYQILIAESAIERGGLCSHCAIMRIDSFGIEGGGPRSLIASDDDFLRDAAYAEAVLDLAVNKFPKLSGLSRRISDSIENIRRDNRLE